jgi:hypothetical protein
MFSSSLRRVFAAFAGVAGCLLAGGAAQAQYLYGITDGGSLYEINPTIGYTAQVFSQTLGVSGANGLAWDETNKRAFYFGTVGGTSRFYVWDRATGVQTQITGTRPTASISNGTFFNNAFWYVNNATDTLVRLDLNFSVPSAPTVASFQEFANFDGGSTFTSFSFGDISVRASDGVLFGSSNNGIFSVNINSGTPTGFNLINSSSTLYQIGFGANGTLYGETSANGNWFTINQGTGVATPMGYSSSPVAFNDISEGSVVGVAVPEPGTMALALPIVGLALGMIARRRKA